jgi:hypothetical protein
MTECSFLFIIEIFNLDLDERRIGGGGGNLLKCLSHNTYAHEKFMCKKYIPGIAMCTFNFL